MDFNGQKENIGRNFPRILIWDPLFYRILKLFNHGTFTFHAVNLKIKNSSKLYFFKIEYSLMKIIFNLKKEKLRHS